MKFYPLLAIGEYHLNHCEDYFVIEKLGNNQWLCAVMDGCTMGNDSYFASTLVGKLLKKIARERTYLRFYHGASCHISLTEELSLILQQLFSELKIIKNQLFLETNDLLSTLVLLLLDSETNQGELLAIGDGVVCINGQLTIFEQQNTPDYIAYHLNEPFEEWFARQRQRISIPAIHDISIATDGIETFVSVTGEKTTENTELLHFLLTDTTFAERSEMLSMKLRTIEKQYAMKPSDDLAIIRVVYPQSSTTLSRELINE